VSKILIIIIIIDIINIIILILSILSILLILCKYITKYWQMRYSNKFLNVANKVLKNINDSKYSAGVAMLILNIGSRYVSVGLTKSQEAYLTTSVARQLLIFSVAFIGTKDVFHSLILTVIFSLFADYIFNEKSRFCVLPKTLQNFHKEIDIDKDGIISDDELKNAIDVLSNARKKKQEFTNRANILK